MYLNIDTLALIHMDMKWESVSQFPVYRKYETDNFQCITIAVIANELQCLFSSVI